MRKMKFSGRETAVLRAIDFATGTPGADIMAATFMDSDELLSVLNGLLDVGYIETSPACEHVSDEAFLQTCFEVNPAYAHDLRAAIARR